MSGTDLSMHQQGFPNLGNNCYINATYKCLLDIPNVFQANPENLPQESLYCGLCNLRRLKYDNSTIENRESALQQVKYIVAAKNRNFSDHN